MKNILLFTLLVTISSCFATTDYSFANAFLITSTSTNNAYNIATDSKGNIIVTGKFTGTVDFDPAFPTVSKIANNGNGQMFLAKYDSLGNFLWVHTANYTSTYSYGWDVEVDQDDNIFLVERITYNVNGKVETGMSKFNGNTGALIWGKMSQQNTSGAQCQPRGLAILPNGNPVFLATGIGTFGMLTETVSAGNLWQPMLVELNKNTGNLEKLLKIQSGGDMYAYGISCHKASGKLAITGYYKGSTVDFDGDNVYEFTQAPSNQDVFVCVYDVNTPQQYSVDQSFKIGSGGIQQGLAILMKNNGSVIVGGRTDALIDLNPGSGTTLSTHTASYDAFWVEVNSSGDLVNHLNFTGGGSIAPGMIEADAENGFFLSINANATNFACTGAFTDNIPTASDNDAVLYHIDENWNLKKKLQLETANGKDVVRDVAGFKGKLHIVGEIDDLTDFDPGSGSHNLTGQGIDGFIQTLNLDFGIVTKSTKTDLIEFNAFPNPVGSLLNVNAPELIQNITVVDATGKVVLSELVNGKQHQIDTSVLSTGMYFVKVQFHNGTLATKGIVK